MQITLQKMTRPLCHQLFQSWENDPAIYMDMTAFHPYVYDAEQVDRYFDAKQDATRVLLAIMGNDVPIGELQLKQIDLKNKTCTLSRGESNPSRFSRASLR